MSSEVFVDAASGQFSLSSGEEEHAAFVDKFKPKVTTDDCYTPPNVYEAVANWVAKEYHLDLEKFIRPFWPGADFESMKYPPDCVVVDNPPFSIRAKIVKFYHQKDIRYFLFAPTLTLFLPYPDICHIVAGATITYANGAKVQTSFITNMEPGVVVRTAPDLYRDIESAERENVRAGKTELPKYSYPPQVITAARMQMWSKYGIEYKVESGDCAFVRTLDIQRSSGKSIFGGGYLLSEEAAAREAAAREAAAREAAAREAAAREAAATKWELSAREWSIIKSLGGRKSESGPVQNAACDGSQMSLL